MTAIVMIIVHDIEFDFTPLGLTFSVYTIGLYLLFISLVASYVSGFEYTYAIYRGSPSLGGEFSESVPEVRSRAKDDVVPDKVASV